MALRFRYVAALFIAAIPFWPMSASAAWQFTTWGMTPEQVQVAAGGKLAEPTADESCPQCNPVPLLAGHYSTGEYNFRVLFEFDAGRKLQAVDLRMSDGDKCAVLKDSLRSRYGTPIATKEGEPLSKSTRWLDASGGNTLLFGDEVAIDGSCVVLYTPLVSAEGL